MQEAGKAIMVLGFILVLIGGGLWSGLIGKLPGDIFIQKNNSSFYFPVTTCLVISAVLTLLSWLTRR